MISCMDGRQNCRGALLVSRGGGCSSPPSDARVALQIKCLSPFTDGIGFIA